VWTIVVLLSVHPAAARPFCRATVSYGCSSVCPSERAAEPTCAGPRLADDDIVPKAPDVVIRPPRMRPAPDMPQPQMPASAPRPQPIAVPDEEREFEPLKPSAEPVPPRAEPPPPDESPEPAEPAIDPIDPSPAADRPLDVPSEGPVVPPVVEPSPDEPFAVPPRAPAVPPRDEAIEEPFGAPVAPAPQPPDEPAAPATGADGGLFDNLFAAPPAEPASEVFPEKSIFEGLFDPAPQPPAPRMPSMRMWLDNTGRFQTRARLAEILDGKVRLYKDNGRYSTVPLRRLSEVDLAYVREQTDIHGYGSIASPFGA
jgi:hypothetical protein